MSEDKSGAAFEGDAPAAAACEALPDRRELALVAVERTRMPMVVTDPRQFDNPIVLANKAFLDLTGYSAEEVIGRNCRFLQGPETDPAVIDEMRRDLREGRHVDVELLNYRKDGSTFWNQLSISPVEDEDGQLIYHFGSQREATARRRAREMEETERLLLMEVDHRALNALALVQSIVRLSRTADAQSYARAVTDRIDAIARAHKLLARNGWSGAKLDEVLNLEIPPDAGERVRARGPALTVAGRIVQPLALVIHELRTNAERHGALSRPGGRMDIRWTARDHRAEIEWDESGMAAPVEEPATRSFGLSIAQGVIRRQLGGSSEFCWANDGLRIRLDFPTGIEDELATGGHAAET